MFIHYEKVPHLLWSSTILIFLIKLWELDGNFTSSSVDTLEYKKIIIGDVLFWLILFQESNGSSCYYRHLLMTGFYCSSGTAER